MASIPWRPTYDARCPGSCSARPRSTFGHWPSSSTRRRRTRSGSCSSSRVPWRSPAELLAYAAPTYYGMRGRRRRLGGGGPAQANRPGWRARSARASCAPRRRAASKNGAASKRRTEPPAPRALGPRPRRARVFLGTVLYAGWNGGYVGRALADGLHALVGGAAWVLPVALVALGGLMVARSALVDVRPFRAGLIVASLGLMLRSAAARAATSDRCSAAPSASRSAPPARRSSARSCSSSAHSCSRAPRSARSCAARITSMRTRAPRRARRPRKVTETSDEPAPPPVYAPTKPPVDARGRLPGRRRAPCRSHHRRC